MASLVIYENGTLSGVDGSACSSGDFSQPLGPITTLNTTGSAVCRVDASTHYCASGALTLVGASGLEFSWDESAWSASLTNSSADVSYVNKMLYFRQSANATGSSGHFTSSADLTATSALADVTGFSASATGTSIYVSWTAVANASFYILQWGTSSGAAYDSSATVSASSYTASGLTDGEAYAFRVKADGSGRYIDSANYATASATISSTFTDEFDGTSLNARWTTSKTATPTVTVSGSECVVTGNDASDADAVLIYLNTPLVTRAVGTWTIKAKTTSSGDGNVSFLGVNQGASAPTASAAATFNAAYRLGCQVALNGSAYLIYRDTAGTFYYWNTASGVWGTGSTSPYAGVVGTYYRAVIETTASSFRMLLKSEDGLTTHVTTSYVDWSTVCPNTDSMYLWFGDPYTNAYRRNITVDLASKA